MSSSGSVKPRSVPTPKSTSMFWICSKTFSAEQSSKDTLISGYALANWAITAGMEEAANCDTASLTWPCAKLVKLLASFSNSCISFKIRRACGNKWWPTTDNDSWRVVRSNSTIPRLDSNSLIKPLTADWVKCICSLARVKLPLSATLIKALNWRILIFISKPDK